MKQINITIHPFSALIGAAIVCLTMLTVGAVTVQGSSSTRDVSAIEVVSDPHPRDFVRIVEGVPFTVPAGKILVVTGMGWHTPGYGTHQLSVFVDGVSIYAEVVAWETAGTHNLGLEIPTPGIAVAAGAVVTTASTYANYGLALGYLVDA
jgi:hypothetical protein